MSRIQCSYVTISTVKTPRKFDRACILNKGDHPFIKHQSYAHYRFADIKFEKQIQELIKNGTFIQHQHPFSDEVLGRLRDGAMNSKFAARDVKESIRFTR